VNTNKTGARRPPDQTAREQKMRLNPGDEAAPGTPGTGEAICPDCKGSGSVGATQCPNCGGSGKVIKAIGGA
jgi:RecJ-like exonuclease